jgi:3'-phosphoadenosine 5'-phosphosulfate sulfotransferase (PAPS reductase)/FAD synthetase
VTVYYADDALFDEADAYFGDSVQPDQLQPTPVNLVAQLSAPDRELRVIRLIQQAHDIYNTGLADHLDGHTLVASCLLFSGGNDSTTLGHIFKDRASHAIHANTTIGIEQTRIFVRETCEAWGLPLIEKVAPVSFRELVIERGFPGPAMHYKMYQRLKERCLDAARRDLVSDPRKERIVFIAGRRRQESARRVAVPLSERDGSTIWVSPLAFWTSLDMMTYRSLNPDIPRNQASDTLHMSGECLCGAFAHRGELDEIGYWYPEMKAEIEALEAEVRAAGHKEPYCTWGHGQGKPSEKSGPMCSSCDARFQQTDQGVLNFDAKEAI